MSVALKPLALAATFVAGACGPEQQEAGGNNFAGAEIEALPADESSATDSNELAAGVNDPDVNDLENRH